MMQALLTLIVGLLLGTVFFGGLWWTVRRGVVARQPALWFGSSLLLRSAIVVAGFHYVGGSDWRMLLVCLAGFVIARMLIIRLAPAPLAQEFRHAP